MAKRPKKKAARRPPTFAQWLRDNNACESARRWVGRRGLVSCWNASRDPWRMKWLLRRLGFGAVLVDWTVWANATPSQLRRAVPASVVLRRWKAVR